MNNNELEIREQIKDIIRYSRLTSNNLKEYLIDRVDCCSDETVLLPELILAIEEIQINLEHDTRILKLIALELKDN
jgi:hypothetical protein